MDSYIHSHARSSAMLLRQPRPQSRRAHRRGARHASPRSARQPLACSDPTSASDLRASVAWYTSMICQRRATQHPFRVGPTAGSAARPKGRLLGRQQPAGLRGPPPAAAASSPPARRPRTCTQPAPFLPPIHPAGEPRGCAGVYILRWDGAACGGRSPRVAAAPRGATRSAGRNAHDESRRRY